MEDRRKQERSRTFLGARIAYRSRCCTVDCTIRNMSPEGARIVFADVASVPNEFELVIPNKSDSRQARIVWRTRTEAGIHFVQPTQANLVPIDTASRIRTLEMQRAKLERRIAQLCEA